MPKLLFSLFSFIFLSTICISAQSDLNTVNLYKHVDFLASDSLKGRKPGTVESRIAAEYIVSNFKKNGLELLGEHGFQYFKIKTGLEVGDNHLQIGKNNFKHGKDFTVLSFSKNSEQKAGIVFVGYGLNISNNSLLWDDYKALDVKDKWILILRGHPENEKPMSIFDEHADLRSKVLTASDKGAVGVIFVSPKSIDKEDGLIPLAIRRGGVKSNLPVIQIKRDVANIILRKTSFTIEELEDEINMHKKAFSMDCKVKAKIKTEVEYKYTDTQNIVAVLEGGDETIKKQFIVIGAHYDHLGMGGSGSGSRTPDTIAVHNGADDNSSGVASIIEIAELLAKKKSKLKRSILFIAFGAEESGLLGSQYYVNNPLVDLKEVNAMLNFDMVGRFNKETSELSVSGTGTAAEWESLLDNIQGENGLKFSYSKEGYGPSDHASFYANDIPVLAFNTGIHGDYHTPADDISFLNFKGMVRITKMAADLVFELATMDEQLTYQAAGPKNRTSSRGGLKVKLGIMPGFTSTNIKGLKIEGVTKGGAAEKAGILKGDIITAINGEAITNIYDYMNRLKKFKPGDDITVEIKRGEEKKVLNVEL